MTVTIQGRECVVGADVSRWQGDIDWSRFPDTFAFIKASGGDAGLYVDGKYARNAAMCGVPWGPYHFASNAQNNAVTEANYFCDLILGSPWALLPPNRKLPPVLDWEPTRNVPGSGAWVLAFLHQVELRTGVRPVIYTGAYVSLDRVDALRAFDLWLAAYTPQPISCAPWGYQWSIWQWSSTTSVPGIVGNVDRNYATVEWFTRATSGAPAPTQPTPTPEPEEIDVPTIIRIKTKAGEYLYDPCAGTARNISGDESAVLQAAPFSLPKHEFDAGSAMHRILNGDGTTITKLGYTVVG